METDLLTLVEQDGFRAVGKPSMGRGGQYNGPCPFDGCGGTDRFRVQPNYGRYGWFACNQCGRTGSAIDYLILKRGLSKQEALAFVGWTPKDRSTPTCTLPTYALDTRPQWNEPPERWQEGAANFCRFCQRTLWSEQGRHARDYLRRRGLTEKTIKAACIGYHASDTDRPAKAGGKTVKLPRGIVFPWFFEGKVWRITIRNECVAEGPGRYTQVAGGSNGLYLADSLGLKRPLVVMTEGELDALSVAQECGDLVAVVATGTTQGSHTPRWVALLARQERVLIAFDAQDTGDRAATWWLQRLENAQRLRPWWKDANQMLQEGADLRYWLTAGFTSPPSAASDELSSACSICGAEVGYYSEQGVAYCGKHWQTGQPRPYTPLTLPPLPRTCCPFECVVERKTKMPHSTQYVIEPRTVPCKGKVLSNGWCEEHQVSQQILEAGALINYPSVQLGEHRSVGVGKACWEAHVLRGPLRWLQRDLAHITFVAKQPHSL